MNDPKLIINTDIPVNRMQAKSQEEQDFIDLVNEIGNQGVIELAMSLQPGRDFSENPINIAKDVICNLYSNGGQESGFFGYDSTNTSPGQYIDNQDRISIDC
jgi:hypothetical protein